ncbi:hypothetical protein BU16DRAFT_170516 [Lophium mytilinum]|uniref:C3H1-type domain-containing protein n=1 Tax=Lophium mytilinum TaxID=390894 RepID=A0A6A6QD87_9PEZI|nr:hypothetical protein BU16DRAFT_170516 [Lophium mytilinum]
MGGKQAADLLHGHMAHLIDATENIPRTAKIVTRVYANFKGLADICYKVGIIDDRCKIEEFARGFTRGRHLFDFVDVGPGKDRADEKIIETLKLYVGNIHCRQIFFGCSHDNGYARVLEEDAHDEFFNTRVTLLEGVPFEKELQELPFRTQKFEGLFRDTKILNPDRPTYGLPPSFPPAFNPQMGRQAMIAGNVNNTPGSSPYLSRNPSISTVASNDLSGFPALVPQPTTVTWANRAAAPPPPPKSPPPKFAPASSTPTTVPRNRAGQRVDPQSANYNKEEVNRVKNLKMCNVHFLRNECPFGAQCTHVHSYKPTRNELETLKLVARMAPCINGSSCDDIKCIYGHRCPAPDPKNGGSPAGGKSKTCIFADKCKFPPELHGIDTNVVKRIVIRN